MIRLRVGQVYRRTRKIAVQGGVKFPVGEFETELHWITEKTVSPDQDLGDVELISFDYNVARSELRRPSSPSAFPSLSSRRRSPALSLPRSSRAWTRLLSAAAATAHLSACWTTPASSIRLVTCSRWPPRTSATGQSGRNSFPPFLLATMRASSSFTKGTGRQIPQNHEGRCKQTALLRGGRAWPSPAAMWQPRRRVLRSSVHHGWKLRAPWFCKRQRRRRWSPSGGSPGSTSSMSSSALYHAQILLTSARISGWQSSCSSPTVRCSILRAYTSLKRRYKEAIWLSSKP